MSCKQCEKYTTHDKGFGGLNDFPSHHWKVIEGQAEQFDSASFFIPEGKAECVQCKQLATFKFDPEPHQDGYHFKPVVR